jgi:hypothetical protein
MALSARSRSVGGHELALFLAIILAGYASTPCRNGRLRISRLIFLRRARVTCIKSFRNPQRGTFVMLPFLLLLAEAAGATPCPIGLRNGSLLGWVATGVRVRAAAPWVVTLRWLVPWASAGPAKAGGITSAMISHSLRGDMVQISIRRRFGIVEDLECLASRNKSVVTGRFHSSSWYHGFLHSE